MKTAIEGVRILLNSIKLDAERLTSANVAHNGNSIRLIAESAISIYEEALNEQREIDIQRAYEWLINNIHNSDIRDNIEYNFKQAMKGE